MNAITKITVLLLIALTLTGCAPMYDVRHEFVAPTTDEGRSCAARCISEVNSCKNQCRLQQSNCESMNQIAGVANNVLKANSKQPTLHGNDYQRSCSNYSCINECEQSRFSCHEMCGGEVRTHTICTAFCDQKNSNGLFSY